MTDLARSEEQLRATLASMPPKIRALFLEALTLGDRERASAIGRLYRDGRFESLTELLIDLEEDAAARALVVGMLREQGIRDREG